MAFNKEDGPGNELIFHIVGGEREKESVLWGGRRGEESGVEGKKREM